MIALPPPFADQRRVRAFASQQRSLAGLIDDLVLAPGTSGPVCGSGGAGMCESPARGSRAITNGLLSAPNPPARSLTTIGASQRAAIEFPQEPRMQLSHDSNDHEKVLLAAIVTSASSRFASTIAVLLHSRHLCN